MSALEAQTSPIDIKNLHYSLAQKYYDKHTLYTDAGAIPKDKIERIFGDAVNRCAQNLKLQGIKIDPTHKVNLVTNKDNQSLGYAYIWVNDEKLYNICNGLNPDGSARIKTIPDPNWRPRVASPSTVPSTSQRSATPNSYVIPSGTDWAALNEDEEEEPTEAPLIDVKEAPLIQYDEYTYSSQELVESSRIIKYSLNKKAGLLFNENIAFEETKSANDKWESYTSMQNLYKNQGYTDVQIFTTVITILDDPENEGMTFLDFADRFGEEIDDAKEDFPVPAKFKIDVSGSYVTDVAEDEVRYELFAKIVGKCKVPTQVELRNRFLDFMSDKKTRFPEVRIDVPPNGGYGGSIRVTFDKRTRDAQFALYFTRKVEFPANRCLLLFNIAKAQKTNRR